MFFKFGSPFFGGFIGDWVSFDYILFARFYMGVDLCNLGCFFDSELFLGFLLLLFLCIFMVLLEEVLGCFGGYV